VESCSEGPISTRRTREGKKMTREGKKQEDDTMKNEDTVKENMLHVEAMKMKTTEYIDYRVTMYVKVVKTVECIDCSVSLEGNQFYNLVLIIF
jgi:hypothetical protein